MLSKKERKRIRWEDRAERRQHDTYIVRVDESNRFRKLLRDPLRLGPFTEPAGPPVLVMKWT
jgi:hypothetical protein